MLLNKITDRVIPLWTGCQNWVSWNWNRDFLCSRLPWTMIMCSCQWVHSKQCCNCVELYWGGGWQCLMRADGSQCSTSDQMWLMTSPFDLWHLLQSLLKVWWAVNTKVHPQCLTREVKHLFFKLELIKGRPNGY